MKTKADTKTAEAPSTKAGGITFIPIPVFTELDAAFGARRKDFIEDYHSVDVPRKYRDLMSDLFFNGGKVPPFAADIDRKAAMMALRAWLRSFDPKHESKEATVAYALWVWSTPADQRAA